MMSYYQKYRPDKFGQLDLVSVRAAFEAMMTSGQVAHAYLFVGPRGSGKTSSARILSRLVNCKKNYTKGELDKKLSEPCGECEACRAIKNGSAVDVMEIDAASHRGIDDIRDLRDKVNLVPAALPRKVYIIDEVHMLTTEAFNALLKTLEEPPEHVLFILCTTEAHKVPETIVSRCVRINFSKGKTDELVASLKRAAEGEGLSVDEAALELLAAGVDGSFREGHKLLEQMAGRFGKITADGIKEALSLVVGNQIEKLLSLVATGNAKGVVEEILVLEQAGVDPVSLVTKLLENLKTTMRVDVEAGRAPNRMSVRLARRLVRVGAKVKISPLPLLPLEMVLVDEALRRNGRGAGGQSEVVNQPAVTKKEEAEVRKEVQKEEEPVTDRVSAHPVDFDKIVTGWQELLSRLAPRNHSVAGLLRSAKPKDIKDKFLTIEVFYKFHKDQLEQEARRKIIEEEIAKLWGPISVKCVLGEKVARIVNDTGQIQKVSEAESLAAAEEIFGT